MKLLLDTSVLLWWLTDDDRLGIQARTLIADPAHEVMVSAVSLWEIVVNVRIGPLDAVIADILAALDRDGFTRLAIATSHLTALAGLPGHPDHRDPFDHLLIAQAIAEDATFLSDDRNTARYPVRAMPCLDVAT